VQLPEGSEADAGGDTLSLSEHDAHEVFADYYRRRHGVAPAPERIALFRELEESSTASG
jgi:hypothetical protein